MTRARVNSAWELATNYAVLLVLVAIALYLSLSTSTFWTITNLTNVLQQVSMVGIIAMGMTMLLISRNFDLSVGAIAVLSAVIGAKLINSVGTGAGMAATLAVATALGAVNGITVTALRVNSLVATLGTGLIFSGLALVLSGTAPVVLENDTLKDLMGTKIAEIPVPGILFAAVVAASTWLLHCTVVGRRLFAIGSNPDAARYAGIRVDRTIFVPFVVTGICCGIAALILMGLLNSASPTAATTWPLDVIAAAVIGGVSIAGGRGNIGMAVIGVFLIGVVANGFNLLDVDPNYRGIFTGTVIVGAVAADQFLRQGRATAFPWRRAEKEVSEGVTSRPANATK